MALPRVRRREAATALACLICLLGCGGEAPQPNILLVSIDSLRPDHLGAYRYARNTSPTLDALAAEGVLFDDAVSTTSWTLPAHAALFTGLYDSGHGVGDTGQRLAERHETLAERFAAAGYESFGVYAGPYLHPAFGLAQGFEHYSSCMTKISENQPDLHQLRPHRRSHEASHRDVTGPCVVETVRSWLARRAGEPRPWFAFLHLWDPHYDYLPPPEYAAMFATGYDGDLDGRGFMSDPRIHRNMPARDLEHLLALYDAEIRFTDDTLGELLALLGAAPGGGDDVIVVVTADHGDEFFEHGDKGHQKTLFEEVVRIPLVIRAPASQPGTRIPDAVRIIDVAPTLLALAGLPPDPAMHGRDLTPLLRGETLPALSALLELSADGRDLRALRSGGPMSAHPWKLIRGGNEADRFHDLARDPAEQRPMAAGDARIAPARHALDAMRASALGIAAPNGEIDAELSERLRALGYIDDAKTDERTDSAPP